MVRAKIFLSCGQRSGTDEVTCAKRVKSVLENFGFEVFLSIDVQEARALVDIIYPELNDSDYFVFLDFTREALNSGSTSRGSLFSHQELSIASFLRLPFLPFQERGVERNGILGVIMGNADVFDSKSELPNIVQEKVLRKLESNEWNLVTKNRLTMRLADGSKRPDRTRRPDGLWHDRTHYHIEVLNEHHRKLATNCCAYIERLVVNGEMRVLRQAELKWEGVGIPLLSIRPQMKRNLDAFLVLGEQPPFTLSLPSHTDAGGQDQWDLKIHDASHIEVTFILCCEQFRDARLTLGVDFLPDQKLLSVKQ